MINHTIEGSGRDIIFLHGFGGSVKSFFYAADRMKDRFRVTLLDFYGFGDTPPLDRPMELSDYVDSVSRLIEHYNMCDVTLVAHSFGGRVAIRLASESDKIKRLLLTDSAGVLPRRGLKYYFKVYSYKFFKRLGIELNSGSSDYKSMSGVMKKTFINIVNTELTPILKNIKCPTLLVWGQNDKDTPLYMADIMKKEISDSHLIIFENCGHFAYIEQADRFVGVLEAFLYP